MVVVSKKVAPKVRIDLQGEPLKQVTDFTYLNCVVIEDCRCEKEIKKRIAIAKNVFGGIKAVLTCKRITLGIRKRLIKT